MSLEALARQGDRIRASSERVSNSKVYRYFPDCLPTCKPTSLDRNDHLDPKTGDQLYCRALYPVHVGFFGDGAIHRERVLIAANRIGKTDAGCCEVTYHATGIYPEWWTGKRFEEAVLIWIAGDTGKTVRDIIQNKLLGPRGSHGTGFIPAHLLLHTTAKSGIADAVEGIYVTHVSGANSLIMLKSSDQRREAFQGTAIHQIWLDEEPPEDIYVECLLRTAKTSDFPGGSLMMTFTPLQGLTKLVQDYQKAVKEQREADDEHAKTAVQTKSNPVVTPDTSPVGPQGRSGSTRTAKPTKRPKTGKKLEPTNPVLRALAARSPRREYSRSR